MDGESEGKVLDIQQILDLVRRGEVLEALNAIDGVSGEFLGLLEGGDYWAERLFAELTSREQDIPMLLKRHEEVLTKAPEFKPEELSPITAPRNPYNTMGTLYHVKANRERTAGYYDKARKYYEKAKELDARSDSVILNLGILELDHNNFGEALARAREALEIKDSAPAHTFLGAIYLQKGFPDRAEMEFETAVKNDPGYDEAKLHQAIAQIRLGKYADAKKTLVDLIGIENV